MLSIWMDFLRVRKLLWVSVCPVFYLLESVRFKYYKNNHYIVSNEFDFLMLILLDLFRISPTFHNINVLFTIYFIL